MVTCHDTGRSDQSLQAPTWVQISLTLCVLPPSIPQVVVFITVVLSLDFCHLFVSLTQLQAIVPRGMMEEMTDTGDPYLAEGPVLFNLRRDAYAFSLLCSIDGSILPLSIDIIIISISAVDSRWKFISSDAHDLAVQQ